MTSKDITSKTLIKRMVTDLANVLLHLDIDPNSVELLETQHQRVEERRADLVARVRHKQADAPSILHIEIQNDNDADMPLRMLRYYTDIRFTYGKEPLKQYLIYIGKRALNMDHGIKEPCLDYHYHILDMRTVDCDILLKQNSPDALVMAILCDFKGQAKQDVVNHIAFRLKTLLQNDEARFENYFTMLQILAQNRHLEQEIEECKTMLTEYDVTKFATYQWGMKQGLEKGMERGMEQGLERGIEQGLERGMEQGEIKGQLAMAKRLLKQGLVSKEHIAQMLDMPVDRLEQLLEDKR